MRFYNIFNQYIDRDFISVDDRNKPFDKTSEQVISLDNFFNFYKNTDEFFHILSFQKISILSTNLQLSKKFYKNKNIVISHFSKPDLEYVEKMIDIKKPLKSIKDLFQIYKIFMELTLLNNQKFKLNKNFGYLREDLIFEDLTGSPSKVDKKLYLDELLGELS